MNIRAAKGSTYIVSSCQSAEKSLKTSKKEENGDIFDKIVENPGSGNEITGQINGEQPTEDFSRNIVPLSQKKSNNNLKNVYS